MEEAFAGLVISGRRALLPLKSSSVRAEVENYVVGLNSVLKYINDGDAPVEVQFRFPVDESYAVVGLEAIIEGRKISAEIKKKDEARKQYKKAIASGHTAALAEEKSGDIFSIALGNLPVGAEAELHLRLVGELPIDAEGGVRFTLPAVLKPRYTPTGSQDPLAPAGGAKKGQAPAVCDFHMNIKSEGVSDVTSPTHQLSVNREEDIVKISLGEGDAQPLKKDLVVLIQQTEPHTPKVVYELGDTSKSQRSYMGAPAVMLSFFPEFEVKRAACEFVFLVDRSGSMRGSYIKSASETLVLFLKSIPPGCSFNIIGFGSSHTSLFPESVSYNQETLEQAIWHAQSLEANLGGTELLSPLKHIFKQHLLPGLSRQIFVLTDGSVSNTQLCIDEVTRNVDKCRVFTFGIGSGASTSLVNGLAKAGGGTSEFIKEGERMQPKVISSLKRALQPSVTDLEVDFDVPSGFEAFQAPSNIPTLFKGDKVVVYGILRSRAASDTPLQSGVQGKASLKGRISGESFMHSLSFDVPAPPILGEDQLESSTGFEIPVIHHLAAKSLLSDWKNGKGWSSTALTQEMEQESTNLSIESSVVCEHTAFVAIDQVKQEPIEEPMVVHDVISTMAVDNLFADQSMTMCLSAPMALNYSNFDSALLGSDSDNDSFCDEENESACEIRELDDMLLNRSAPAAAKNSDVMFSQQYMQLPPDLDKGVKKRASNVPPQASSLPGSLTTLISLQHANGYWLLKDMADKIIKKNESEMKCPPKISNEAWATIVALVLLERNYLGQKDEWELVALKAEMWLNSQTLPLDIDTLKEKAKNII